MRNSRADQFNQDTVILIQEALEIAAKQQEARTVGLPREYRTGVTNAELLARECAERRAAEYRAAQPLVQAIYNRARSLKTKLERRDD